MKKAITLSLAVSLVFLLIGCGKTSEPQTYYATSATLSAYGKELQGPRGIEPEEIYLIVDGNDMEFHNYGKTYIGHRQKDGSQVIEWDEEPLLLKYSRLSFTSLVPCSKNDQPDGYELWFNLTYYGEDYSMLAGIDYKIRLR